MIKKSSILIFGIILFVFGRLNSQEKLSSFYRIVFYPDEKSFGFYPEPDSLKNNSNLSEYALKMWQFNNYLYSNYSLANKQYDYLVSLIPDSIKIISVHNRLLNEDKEFKDMFFSVLFKTQIYPDISIDNLTKIASRFFYFHKVNGRCVIHMCAGINGIKELKPSVGSPFYNAFCFMVIFTEDGEKIKERILEQYKDELNQTVSEKRVLEIRSEIFNKISEDKDLKQLIINEFIRKKEFLNFNVNY